MKNYAITIKNPFARWIGEGKKTMELRTRIPNELDIGSSILIVEADNNGKLIGIFEVEEIICAHPIFLGKPYYYQHRVPIELFEKYVGDRDEIYGIKLKKKKIFRYAHYCFEVGIKKSPQWFTEVKEMSKTFFWK